MSEWFNDIRMRLLLWLFMYLCIVKYSQNSLSYYLYYRKENTSQIATEIVSWYVKGIMAMNQEHNSSVRHSLREEAVARSALCPGTKLTFLWEVNWWILAMSKKFPDQTKQNSVIGLEVSNRSNSNNDSSNISVFPPPFLASGAIPIGYTFHLDSGIFLHQETGFTYNPKSNLYMGPYQLPYKVDPRFVFLSCWCPVHVRL